ncbi:MAG TPA: hypothetical protein VGD26_12700, partial [Chitinophagaceae bacterium]
KVFSQTQYDNNIINSLQLYDSLKNILVSNIDTIFNFRNSRNFVFHSGANGDTATIQEDEDSYQFYYDYGEGTSLSYGTGPNDQKLINQVRLENMPAFLYPSVNAIFKKLGKNNIRGFRLWSDSTIEITAKAFRKDDIEVGHTLTWKRKFVYYIDPENFYRDTLIAPKWTYGIWVDEYQGW